MAKKKNSVRNNAKAGNAKGMKPYNRSNQRRNNSTKRQREASEIEDTAIAESKSNPYSPWYDKFPYFTEDAGKLAFSQPLGQNLDPEGALYIPGIMRLTFYPTIGYSADNNSAVNRSTKRFYTYQRTVMKSANKYDPADIMMHNMAIDSAYMFLSLMKRAYRCGNLFSPLNKYYPKYLMRLAGFDDETISANLSDFRAYINRYALQLQAFVVPKNFEITSRHMWMCEGLYLDSDNARAQTYMFVPEGFWKFNNTVTTGSQLDWVPWIGTDTSSPAKISVHTLDQIMEIGNSLIGAIVGDQDTGNISGDMVLAYGADGVRRAEELQDMSIILPTYDETVLSQIENATIVGPWANGYTPVISQDPSVNNGAILFTPTFAGDATVINGADPSSSSSKVYAEPLFTRSTSFINMHKDSPNFEEVIEASRLHVAVKTPIAVSTTGPINIQPTSFGADVICSLCIAKYTTNVGVKLLGSFSNCIFVGSLGSSSQTRSTEMQFVALSECFDWAPLIYLWEFDTTSKTPTTTNIVAFAADVDNIAPVTYQQLDMMHEATMLSLMDVPDFRA